MRVCGVLAELGGVATRAQLCAVVSRAELDRAHAAGAVVRSARDRYALPTVDEAVAKAHAVSGVLCLTSAALHHGWAVKLPPERPHVSVRKNRRLTAAQQAAVAIHRHDLAPGDIVDGIVTSKEVTLVHCLRVLPPDEALAVADSAARDGELALLRRVARAARGPGSVQVRDVAAAARPEAANPFESVLRSIAGRVDGLRVEPQRLITTVTPWARPDLVDAELRIVLEADSFEWHGDRSALRRDARRYNRLVADGWLVLRFSWEDVMHDPESVRAVLVGVVALARGRTETAYARRPLA